MAYNINKIRNPEVKLLLDGIFADIDDRIEDIEEGVPAVGSVTEAQLDEAVVLKLNGVADGSVTEDKLDEAVALKLNRVAVGVADAETSVSVEDFNGLVEALVTAGLMSAYVEA